MTNQNDLEREVGTAGVLTAEDIEQLRARGSEMQDALEQLNMLRHQPPAIVLVRPCTIQDGVLALDLAQQERFEKIGRQVAAAGRLTKFVPASGAASRMFKELVAALENRREAPSDSSAFPFFQRFHEFPFAEELKRRSGTNEPSNDAEERHVLRVLLEEMDFARVPKGLIPFHRSGSSVRTAFEEHLVEGCSFARSSDGICRFHFTVSPEAIELFEAELLRVRPSIEEQYGCKIEIEFSIQDPATDTLAIDAAGAPFRCADGRLLFRPGGHGALIRNLEAIGGDIVSIKNIDNILPAERAGESVRWKTILAGAAADIQEKVFEMLRAAEQPSAGEELLDAAMRFASATFNRRPSQPLTGVEESRQFVIDALHRPLRICGVVRNEGEPGGAPFWVRDKDGSETVQIVEASQVDRNSPGQKAIFNSSSHFNPVDIVCALRDHRGDAFELSRFVDHDAVFVSTKFHEGRELRALELPGLWNGAMAKWNTVCVEVPASTFAPVKTVLDLLRPQHQ